MLFCMTAVARGRGGTQSKRESEESIDFSLKANRLLGLLAAQGIFCLFLPVTVAHFSK